MLRRFLLLRTCFEIDLEPAFHPPGGRVGRGSGRGGRDGIEKEPAKSSFTSTANSSLLNRSSLVMDLFMPNLVNGCSRDAILSTLRSGR